MIGRYFRGKFYCFDCCPVDAVLTRDAITITKQSKHAQRKCCECDEILIDKKEEEEGGEEDDE